MTVALSSAFLRACNLRLFAAAFIVLMRFMASLSAPVDAAGTCAEGYFAFATTACAEADDEEDEDDDEVTTALATFAC